MASIEDRVRKLIAENLEVDGKPVDSSMALTSSLSDAGVSSLDIVSFGRVIQEEFGIKLTPECCEDLNTLGQLVTFLDTHAA